MKIKEGDKLPNSKVHIIDMGKKLDMLPDKFHTNEFKVEGCVSEVYLAPEKKRG